MLVKSKIAKFSIFLSVCVLFLFSITVKAQIVISRAVPKKTEVEVDPTLTSGSCPTNILPNHISICGTVKTIDINEREGVQYTQEPIKGAAVGLYLGAKYATGIPTSFNWIKADPNQTGEVGGKIEGLYMFDITNDDGRYIVAAPRGVGTGGMAFLAFFCGEDLKDLYMLDTSKDIGFMPVALACPPEVTPPTPQPEPFTIPVPPSVSYADRVDINSCEPGAGIGDTGKVKQVEEEISIPLESLGLDDTRLGAEARVHWTAVCDGGPLEGCVVEGGEDTCTTQFGPWVICSGGVPGSNQNCCCPNTCSGEGGSYTYCEQGYDDGTGSSEYTLTNITSSPWDFDYPNGPPYSREIPLTEKVLSGRDLEGFTHTSLGYSLQAISSLNCGISGCYDVHAPTLYPNQDLRVSKDVVKECNTEGFPPLYCKGPGIELAEPSSWTASYFYQLDKDVFDSGIQTQIGDVTLPQYSGIGQILEDGGVTWIGSEVFPYSLLLNLGIGLQTPAVFQNRPTNDSYRNLANDAFTICLTPEEGDRLYSGIISPAIYPFKACYIARFPAEDTYSTQKALYTTTRNTSFALTNPDSAPPVVSKFIAPNEQIGDEVSPAEGSIPSSAMKLTKVGRGYWRIGIVNTLCTNGSVDASRTPFSAIYGR